MKSPPSAWNCFFFSKYTSSPDIKSVPSASMKNSGGNAARWAASSRSRTRSEDSARLRAKSEAEMKIDAPRKAASAMKERISAPRRDILKRDPLHVLYERRNISPLVVVPREYFHELAPHDARGGRVDDRRVRLSHDIRRDQLLVRNLQ